MRCYVPAVLARPERAALAPPRLLQGQSLTNGACVPEATGSKCKATLPYRQYCAACDATGLKCLSCNGSRSPQTTVADGRCALPCKQLYGIGCLACNQATCTAQDSKYAQGKPGACLGAPGGGHTHGMHACAGPWAAGRGSKCRGCVGAAVNNRPDRCLASYQAVRTMPLLPPCPLCRPALGARAGGQPAAASNVQPAARRATCPSPPRRSALLSGINASQ